MFQNVILPIALKLFTLLVPEIFVNFELIDELYPQARNIAFFSVLFLCNIFTRVLKLVIIEAFVRVAPVNNFTRATPGMCQVF